MIIFNLNTTGKGKKNNFSGHTLIVNPNYFTSIEESKLSEIKDFFIKDYDEKKHNDIYEKNEKKLEEKIQEIKKLTLENEFCHELKKKCKTIFRYKKTNYIGKSEKNIKKLNENTNKEIKKYIEKLKKEHIENHYNKLKEHQITLLLSLRKKLEQEHTQLKEYGKYKIIFDKLNLYHIYTPEKINIIMNISNKSTNEFKTFLIQNTHQEIKEKITKFEQSGLIKEDFNKFIKNEIKQIKRKETLTQLNNKLNKSAQKGNFEELKNQNEVLKQELKILDKEIEELQNEEKELALTITQELCTNQELENKSEQLECEINKIKLNIDERRKYSKDLCRKIEDIKKKHEQYVKNQEKYERLKKKYLLNDTKEEKIKKNKIIEDGYLMQKIEHNRKQIKSEINRDNDTKYQEIVDKIKQENNDIYKKKMLYQEKEILIQEDKIKKLQEEKNEVEKNNLKSTENATKYKQKIQKIQEFISKLRKNNINVNVDITYYDVNGNRI